MNEETEKPQDEIIRTEEVHAESPGRGNQNRLILVSVAAAVAIGAVLIVLLWPRQAGRPVPAPRSVSFEESPQTPATTEQRLVLTPEQVRSAQLKIETVGEQPSSEAAGQMATGVVQSNIYKETPIVSLVGGIVRNVSAELGQNVKRGQRVAVVFSNELADAQTRYLAAVAALDEHHRHHLRTARLVEIGAASRQEVETANSQYRESESNVANLRQKLLLLGMPAQRIDSLNSTSQVSSEVNVSSPSSGTVTSRTANPGEVIEANRELMRVTDLSSVWVVAQVYERDLATVRVGTGANVTSDAYPNRVFHGRVSYVDPKIDPSTRTAQVRIELGNPAQMLKIGMFMNVVFGALGMSQGSTPVIAKDAVQSVGTELFVFMPTEKPTEFVMRVIHTGPEGNGLYSVLEGLKTGDHVITEGSFLLRAEWAKVHPNH